MHNSTNSLHLPRFALDLLNQLFEIEIKVQALPEGKSMLRNLNRIASILKDDLSDASGHKFELFYHNPLHEKYDETRTDCDASISGEGTENLLVVKVIKPAIFVKRNGRTELVQKAVVIAETKNSKP